MWWITRRIAPSTSQKVVEMISKQLYLKWTNLSLTPLYKYLWLVLHKVLQMLFFTNVFLQKFFKVGCAKPVNNTIKIKRERAPIVKSEHEMNSTPFESITINCGPESIVDDLKTKVATLKIEKDKLIKEVVSSQEENQKLFFDLKSKQKVIAALQNNKKQFKEKMTSQEKLIEQLTREKSEQSEYEDKLIAQLNRERNASQAKIKQLLACSAPRKKANSTAESTDGEYEVETILDHEVKGGQRRFLIRWKHFSSFHDSWEKESNLNCPEILNSYFVKN